MVDVAQLARRALASFRPHMQMIFQDPFSSLNPRMMIGDIIAEPLLVNGIGDKQSRRARVEELLDLVKLPAAYRNRFPHAFSGGQRQRIGIARALALNPSLVVADEPVSALDVSVQAQIVNLMLELQERLGLSYLFVAHDLSVVKHVSDRVAVAYVGKIVEEAATEDLFSTPRHPYTDALLSAVPKPDPRSRTKRIILKGEVADPAHPPPGCPFHPRCNHAIERCRTEGACNSRRSSPITASAAIARVSSNWWASHRQPIPALKRPLGDDLRTAAHGNGTSVPGTCRSSIPHSRSKADRDRAYSPVQMKPAQK